MKLSAFMRGKAWLTFSFFTRLFYSSVFSKCKYQQQTLFSCVFGLPPHLSPGLHPSLSAELSAVYTLNKVKTAVTKQSGSFDKNI